MSIKGVLLRFFLLYTALLIGAGLVVSHFGIDPGSGLNIGILAGCVFWVCGQYGRKNGRYFSREETWLVVLGLAGINVALQFFFASAALSSPPAKAGAGALIFAVGFVGLLHAAAIYLFVGVAKRPLVKQGIISD